jgi:hypothetical protein
MKAFLRKHLNDILLAFFVMASAARGIGQIYPSSFNAPATRSVEMHWARYRAIDRNLEPLLDRFPR